eukprot:g427.t1
MNLIMMMMMMMMMVITGTHAQSCAPEDSSVVAARHYLQNFDNFALTYFDGRGLAEVSRTLFATAGLFPGAGYSDVRLKRDAFNEMKGKGDLAKNLNRVPLLNHNGIIIGESSAIARYVAKKLSLYGANPIDEAQIDAMCEHILDIKNAWRKLFPYRKDLTDEEKAVATAVWFDTSPEPALEGRKERQLQWFLSKIESMLPGDGYCVGGRPSLADAYFFNLLLEQAPSLGVKGEGYFQNRAKTDEVLAMFPKLQQVVETFGRSPGMKHWLETRGEQGF